MPRGIEPTAPTSSLNPADFTSKRGVSATVADAIVFGPGPPDRGVGIAPANTETLLPR
jgi:hypothetical protein